MLTLFTVDPGRDCEVAIALELIRGHHPGPDSTGAVKVFALGDVELTMAHPVADAALLQDSQAGNVIFGLVFADPSAGLADDDCDLSLIIEVGRFRWTDNWLQMADQ